MSKASPVPQGHIRPAPTSWSTMRAGRSRSMGKRSAPRSSSGCRVPTANHAHAESDHWRLADHAVRRESGTGARSPKAFKGSPVSVFLYVPDVDVLFAKALAAGATAVCR